MGKHIKQRTGGGGREVSRLRLLHHHANLHTVPSVANKPSLNATLGSTNLSCIYRTVLHRCSKFQVEKTIPELNIGSKIFLSPVFIVHLVLFFSFISKRKKQRAVEDDFWQWICCAQ
jgi:hypothetical protein